MSGPTHTSTTHNFKRLFLLRSLMIAGELVALLIVHLGLGVALPVKPLLLILGILSLANIWAWRRITTGHVIPDTEFFLQLTIDVLALTGVLYFTGGASNPFAWFFLIPLIIAATVLSAKATWLIAGLTTLCYSLLMFLYQPLASTGEHQHHDTSFTQHIFGMWFGFVLSAVLVAWFVVGMAKTIRQRDQLLANAREQSLRDEQLVALGTLATGAAHELGTPLATMAIVSGELLRKEDLPADVSKKLQILRSQVTRCKEALSVISASAGEAQAEDGSLTEVRDFIDQTNKLWQSQREATRLHCDIQDEGLNACILNERTLQQSLINLLNNAADASPDAISLKARWDNQSLTINLLDNGPGLLPETMLTLGKAQQQSQKDHGMGLGLFLTNATIQRLGGNIEFFNRQQGGTCTRIRLPLINNLTP
ncbi:MAG: ATP-binding protein [Gammaproteobacteria bacterium]